MNHAHAWIPLWCPLPALALCIACTGIISGPDQKEGNAKGGNSPAAAAAAAADEEMRQKNPELAALAAQYFPGTVPENAPKRVFRLTRSQIDRTTKTLLPLHYSTQAIAAMPADPLETNYEYAAHLGFNAANFTPYTTWVSEIVTRVRSAPKSVVDCSASNNSPTCLADAAKKFVRTAFRGVVSDAQLTRYVDFFTASVAQVGIESATADLVDLVLTSPNYVFRDEVQTNGKGVLRSAQLLQSITYTLADAPPESVGLSSLAADAAVQTPLDVQRTVDEVLATTEARAKLLRFFSSWLEIKEPDEFNIATNVFPEFTPEVAAAVVKETETFLEHQLAGTAPKLKAITESTQSFVSKSLSFIYQVKNPSETALVDLDPAQRLGIFTQPAVLASHSGPTTTRLVKRGVFFTRKVMCLALGSPPADVDTSVPSTAGATERERIETVTKQAKCAGCHAYINPFGFMLENYDAIGRWRMEDEGSPVDPSISVDFLDEGKFTARTPVDALKGFTRSILFQQCFARQLFRFYTGRDETDGDHPVLRQMFFDFANHDNQDIVGMLRILAGSSVLSQRAEAP